MQYMGNSNQSSYETREVLSIRSTIITNKKLKAVKEEKFPSLQFMSSFASTTNKVDIRQINRRKRYKF